MAVNTSGYSVGVLPQYSPVDANLAAFNPAAAMQGAAQGIDMVTGLQKLKDMRQIHEENAKMSAAKNKLLQAQADQQQIIADYEAVTTEKKAAKANSENAAAAKVAAPKADVDIKALEQKAFELGTQAALNPLAREHAIGVQPLVLGTEMTNAAIARDTSIANQRRLPTVTSIADYGADKALVDARGAASRAYQDQDTQDMVSRLKFDDMTTQYEAGQSRETQSAIANLAATEAGTKLKIAEAAKLAAESDPRFIAEKRKVAETNALVQRYNTMESLVNATGKTEVLDPEGTPIKLSQIFDAYYDYTPEGVAVPKNKDSWFSATANLTPPQRLELERYAGMKALAKKLGEQVNEAYGAPAREVQPKKKLRWDAATGTMVEVK